MHRSSPLPCSGRPYRGVAVLLCTGLLLTACSESPLSGVNRTLDARDAAISSRDIAAYEELIADDYKGRQGKAGIVGHVQQLFKQFNQLKMESFGRDVYVADDDHARVAQSYRLKVLMDGSWREMLQREELSLVRTDRGWKISSGL